MKNYYFIFCIKKTFQIVFDKQNCVKVKFVFVFYLLCARAHCEKNLQHFFLGRV